jgi:cell division initiation protein
MAYTPVELRHVRVARSLFGYRPSAVHEVLAEVAESFETVWRERHELADHAEGLQLQLDELRDRERALTQTLVAAEQAAAEIREQARREAELIVAEAHGEARALNRNAQAERQRLHAETRRIESLLRAALGMIEDASPAAGPEVEEHDEHDEPVQPGQPALQRVSSGFGWGATG